MSAADITQKRWVNFQEMEPTKHATTTQRWNVTGSGGPSEYLGVIRWHGAWRQYIFEAVKPAIYNPACLHEIEMFILDQMTARHNARSAAAHALFESREQ